MTGAYGVGFAYDQGTQLNLVYVLYGLGACFVDAVWS